MTDAELETGLLDSNDDDSNNDDRNNSLWEVAYLLPQAGDCSADDRKDAQAKDADNQKDVAKPTDAPVDKQEKLTGEDLKRVQYLQETLQALASVYLNIASNDPERTARGVKDFQEKLQKERNAGVYGPATREAYKEYVGWLQKAVPETIREMDSLQRPLPPGCPIPLPQDRYERSISPQFYKALASEKKLALELQPDPDKLPTDAQLTRLDGIYEWLSKCNESAVGTREQQRELMLNDLIREQGLPKEWHRHSGENRNSWTASAEEMVDLASRTRNYVEAMQSVFKLSADNDFPIELPPRTMLLLETEDGKTYNVSDREITSTSIRYLLKTSKVKEVHLDLPKDLRQDAPANAEKIHRLREWLTKYSEKIDQAVGELAKLKENPDALIMYGDQEVRNGKALLNDKGEFIRLVSDKYTAKTGETVQDTNLLGYDFQVEQITEGPLKGRFKINQTIQAEKAPWYAYENIRAFGIESVGKPMNVDERLSPEKAAARYKISADQLKEMISKGQLQTEKGTAGEELVICPKILGGEDFAPVKDGDKIEMVKAKNLKSFHDTQRAWYVGEKALTVTMDVAMLVTGTIEVAGAIRGARLAAVGAEAALKLTAREAAWEVTKGAVRVGVAGAGILNNAGARDTEWGRNINTSRGIYFLADIGIGLVSSGWNAFRAGKAAEAMSSTEKVHAAIHGQEALEGAKALKGIPWIREAHTGTMWAFKATEYGFAPVIAKHLSREIKAIEEDGSRDPSKDAITQVGDGRGMQQAKPGSFDPTDKDALTGTCAVLEGYAKTLSSGRSKDTGDRVHKILQDTERLLGPHTTEEEKAKYREELLAQIVFTPEQIKELELALPIEQCVWNKSFHLTQEQLRDLMDPEKRKFFPEDVCKLADKLMAERDKDVAAAAKIALLYLARDKDGKISNEPITANFKVPQQERKIIPLPTDNLPAHIGGKPNGITIPESKVNQSMTVSDLVQDLKLDIERSQSGNRGIVIGEVLVRIGAITHQQYGGILQDVLTDLRATREDKLRALQDAHGPRLAAIIDGVHHQENTSDADLSTLGKHRQLGVHHGLSSNDLIATLEKTAKEDKDPDVRTMAAVTLYGLKEKNASRRAELLSGFNTMLEQCKGKEGEFAKKATEFLMQEMKTDLPKDQHLADKVRESRLNAALALVAVSDRNDKAVQKEISDSIVKCFSTQDTALALRVIDALVPDYMDQLQKDSPSAANDLRMAALAHIKNPESKEQERQIIALLVRMEPFLKDGDVELKRQFVGTLHDFLRNNDHNQSYARHYPELRAAAINTLVKDSFLTQNSLDVIRSHVSVQPAIKFGTEQIRCNEPDATVRLAATRALEVLKDPHLRSIINEIIDTETDPAVAAQLRDVRFTKQRIEPSSREYKEIYERTRVELTQFGDKYPYLKDFGDEAKLEWLDEKFPLLKKDKFLERADETVKNATTFAFRRTSFDETIRIKELDALLDLKKERNEQWEELTKLARQGGSEGNKAKLLLHYIMIHNGEPLGSESGPDAIAVKGYNNSDQYHKLSDGYWQIGAARALAKLAGENPEGKDIVAECIKKGLTRNEQIPGEVSLILLKGWRAAGTEDRNGLSVSREELARVTAEALQTEIGRQKPNQSEEFQEELIKALRTYQHRLVFPVLDAMKDGSKFPKIQEQCAQMLSDFRDSISMMWDETKADTQSTPQERADRLKRALEDKHDAETTVQELFSAYKGHKITDAKDPALNQLQLAMRDTNERVRLAASKILMESDLPPAHPAKAKAIQTLTELTFTGSAAAYRKESYEMLAQLNLDKPLILGAPNGRIFELERSNGELRVTEYTNNKVSGYIYPTGGSFRYETNESGEITGFWEDGNRWNRKQEGGKYIDEWSNVADRRNWKGKYQLLEGGAYKYTGKYAEKTWNRKANGKWQATAPKPDER